MIRTVDPLLGGVLHCVANTGDNQDTTCSKWNKSPHYCSNARVMTALWSCTQKHLLSVSACLRLGLQLHHVLNISLKRN